MGKMAKGQIWSVDIIIGIVIFIAIIAVFYGTMSERDSESIEILKQNADTIVRRFNQEPSVQVIYGDNTINMTRLEQLSDLDYTQLKSYFGISGDFCIYLEDENGRIVPIGNKSSMGNPSLNVSSKPCGALI